MIIEPLQAFAALDCPVKLDDEQLIASYSEHLFPSLLARELPTQPTAAVASALLRPTSATEELARDEILDKITLYWLTNTAISVARLYWENYHKLIYYHRVDKGGHFAA